MRRLPETRATAIGYLALRQVARMSEMEEATSLLSLSCKTQEHPKVQHRGDVAVLSFNLVSYAKRPNGGSIIVRWHSTEAFARIEGKWRIMHSHWSYTTPELKTPNPGQGANRR